MRQRRRAIANGFDVNYDNPHGDTWEVYWKIESMEMWTEIDDGTTAPLSVTLS